MKRKFTFKTLIACVVSLATFATAQAQQQAASATWTLLASPTASVSGNITANEQTLGSAIAGVSYNQSYGTAAGGNQTMGWQRVGTTSNIVAGSENAFTQGSYVEYAISATGTNFLQINSVSAEVVGGGTGSARLAAMYSLDNFTTMDSFGVISTYNSIPTRATRNNSVILINGGSGIPTLTGQQILSFTNLAINLNPGQTFRVRFYVWLTSASTTIRHFGERNVVISGVTSLTPLPVTFTSVKAFERNKGVQVEWTSATELNVSKYIIEKSADGRNYKQAGVITPAGNSTVARNYSWYDATPNSGTNFYRIQYVDKDGTTKYTSVMIVNLGKGVADIKILENPVKSGMLNLNLNNIPKGQYSLNFYNFSGQKVFTSQISHAGGSATELIQLPSLSHGTYNVQLAGSDLRLNKRVLVK